jgi:tetratricopeptide (TPR) repeat protein
MMHAHGIACHRQGDNMAAAEWFRRAVDLRSDVPSYHFHLAEALRALERYEDARAAYQRALALDPRNADAHYGLGNALFELHRFAEAVDQYRQALQFNPGDAEALNNLGNALQELGDFDGAAASYRRALEVNPDFAEALLNFGSFLAERGQVTDAASCYHRVLSVDPCNADALLLLGNALRRQDKLSEAVRTYQQALRAAPSSVKAHIGLGLALLELRHFDEAAAAFEAARRLDADNVAAMNGLARSLLFLNRPDDALAVLARAQEIAPEMAEVHLNRGIGLQVRGDFAAAREALERAITLQPDIEEAHQLLSLNERHAADCRETERLEQLLREDRLETNQGISLRYTLAKRYDDLGRFDDAFRHLADANRFCDAEFGALSQAHIDHVDRLIAVFTADLLRRQALADPPSEIPIFIVGMPRSGTSLVEQIIASHPQVFGAGEVGYMQALARSLSSQAPPVRYPDCIPLLSAEQLRTASAWYLDRLTGRAGDAVRITDKLPSNYLRLGLIALLFPRARIIHCHRDPLDTCLSCFFQDFGRNQPLFADLRKLGTVYRQYQRLMAHWRRVLHIRMLDVRYEELVENQERESRRLIEFCGLSWDDRCLAFHRTRRAVNTASFWQVRQPIYTSSIGRWRHYEHHLAPLKEALGLV